MPTPGFQQLELTPGAAAMLRGELASPENLATILADVADRAMGPGGLFVQHLESRQSTWPTLAESTRKDKRKRDSRKFVASGRVLTAISQPGFAKGARVLKMSSAKAGGPARVRVSRGGMYVSVAVKANGAGSATVGFSGKLNLSKGFKKIQKDEAKRRGLKHGLSRAATRDVARAGGVNKYGKAGANNLAYASVLQSGVFRGVVGANTGRLHSGADLARAKGRGFKVKGQAVHGVARPLLPLDGADTKTLIDAMVTALDQGAKAMGWK